MELEGDTETEDDSKSNYNEEPNESAKGDTTTPKKNNEEHNKRLEAARKKYDLTSEEIETLLRKKTKSKKYETELEDELNFTLTQKLNFVIYGSFILVIIYVLNRDYDSVVSMWFASLFPKEAKTLGFRMIVDDR